MPVEVVTTTARIVLFGPVMICVTVPIWVPLLLLTVMLVARPVSVLLDTAPRARTLLLLACAMPVADAWLGPWLFTVA